MRIPLSGHHLLAATAGSGKTSAAQSYIRGQYRAGVPLREIAGMSFTRVGSLTLAQRVAAVESVATDDLDYFRTIHSHCFRLLGLTRGQVMTEKQRAEFFRAVVRMPFDGGSDVDAHDWSPASRRRTPGALMLAFVEWQRNRMLDIETAYRQYRRPPELAPWWTPHAVKRFADSYLNYKIDNGCLDFTDMLALTWKEGLTLPVRVLVCDEFQDCTTLQNTLVLHWAMQCDAALMLGDCDQLIYGHLGAVPADFLDTPGDRHALGTNYRSGDTIVSFADRLIRRNQERVALPVHADHAGGLVQRLAALPRLDPERSTFVLARAHYLLNPIARLLEQRGTPFAMRRGSMGIPLNMHDKTFAAFRAVQALRSGRQVAPFSLHQLAQFVRGPYFTHGAKAAIQRMSAQDDGSGRLLIGLYDLPQFGGTPALIDAITHDRPDLLNRANPERIAYWRRVAKTYGDAVLSTTPKIQLSTIHGVKGDEADDVYLLSDITPSVGEAMRASKRGLEAERRVFYVAATRARERLFVLPAQSGQQFEEVMPRRSA